MTPARDVYDLTYLSFGAGVQSTALLVCSNLGLHNVPRADVAIFADTGYEAAHTYETVKLMQEWSTIPLVTVHAKESVRKRRFVGVPVFIRNDDGTDGIAWRQCTSEWKMKPISAEVRRLLGYEPGQRVKKSARALIGISSDEAHRMKPARDKWVTNAYPLVDARIRRSACVLIVEAAGLPRPSRSACVFCPYHSATEWKYLRDNHPEDWAKAIAYDDSLRDGTSPFNKPAFVHRQLVPLVDAQLDRPEESLFGDSWGNECEGMCGV